MVLPQSQSKKGRSSVSSETAECGHRTIPMEKITLAVRGLLRKTRYILWAASDVTVQRLIILFPTNDIVFSFCSVVLPMDRVRLPSPSKRSFEIVSKGHRANGTAAPVE